MTHDFRKAAYAAVEEAEALGARANDTIEFQVGPARYLIKFDTLKHDLYADRKVRKARRASVRTA